MEKLDHVVEALQQATGERMLQFFKSDHLPDKLRGVSQKFSLLAGVIVEELPRNAERTVALRKLLEAKDCAVRSVLEGA